MHKLHAVWGLGGGSYTEKRYERTWRKKEKKQKARSCIVVLQEERGGLNKREGENWQRKGLTMSPSGIKLSRNLL